MILRDQTLLDDANVVVLDIEYFYVTSHLDDITVSSDEIRLTLKVVPISKASWPDIINDQVLKELADQLATPLCSLFNQSIHDGCIPEIWKMAHVSPNSKIGH